MNHPIKQQPNIVEALDTPDAKPAREFPINAYMQIADFAMTTHFMNMMATYGEDQVMAFIKNVFKLVPDEK